MLAYEDVPEAKAPVMVLPIDVGHSIGVVQDPGVTQRVTDDGNSNDQGTNQGVDHQGKSVLPPSSGLCDGRCCSGKRTRACTLCPTYCCVSDPDPSIKCTQYEDGTNDTFVIKVILGCISRLGCVKCHAEINAMHGMARDIRPL